MLFFALVYLIFFNISLDPSFVVWTCVCADGQAKTIKEKALKETLAKGKVSPGA